MQVPPGMVAFVAFSPWLGLYWSCLLGVGSKADGLVRVLMVTVYTAHQSWVV